MVLTSDLLSQLHEMRIPSLSQCYRLWISLIKKTQKTKKKQPPNDDYPLSSVTVISFKMLLIDQTGLELTVLLSRIYGSLHPEFRHSAQMKTQLYPHSKALKFDHVSISFQRSWCLAFIHLSGSLCFISPSLRCVEKGCYFQIQAVLCTEQC